MARTGHVRLARAECTHEAPICPQPLSPAIHREKDYRTAVLSSADCWPGLRDHSAPGQPDVARLAQNRQGLTSLAAAWANFRCSRIFGSHFSAQALTSVFLLFFASISNFLISSWCSATMSLT